MSIDTTLEDIYRHISVRISGRVNDYGFVKELSSFQSGFVVDKQQALIIKNQFVALGLLEEFDDGVDGFVRLSELGKKVMRELNAPKST